MKIKLRTKERTIKMRGESASLSPKQRHRKAMALRAIREKAAQAAPSKQPEQPSIEASAVDQVQQVGEFTARKAAYIAHEKRKLQKQQRSKTAKTEHTDNGTSNNAAQPTWENYRPIHTAETAEGKPSAVSRNEDAIPKVAHALLYFCFQTAFFHVACREKILLFPTLFWCLLTLRPTYSLRAYLL